MRLNKHFSAATGLSVSTESIVVAVLSTKPVLSLEEEIIALQEADELQTEIADGIDETVRVEDISDNLLNIADVAEPVEAITPEQAALIDTAGEMAVAGTDTPPEAVIPAMEAFIGGKMNVGELRKMAATIWENIRKFFTNLWQKIRVFFTNLFSVLPRQLNRIKALREAIAVVKKAGANQEPKNPRISVFTGISALSYAGKTVDDTADLLKGFAELSKLGDYVYFSYPKQVKRQGDIIADELKGFDPLKYHESLSGARKKMVQANFTETPKSPSIGYMGSFTLEVRRINPKESGSMSDAMVLNALRHTGVSITQTATSSITSVIDSNPTFKTMSINDAERALDAIEHIVKQIIAFEGGADWKAMDSTRKTLEDAGNKAKDAWDKLTNESMTQGEKSNAYDVMKGLMNFNTTYGKWVSNLPGLVTKKILSATRTSLILVEKSIGQYSVVGNTFHAEQPTAPQVA